MTPPARRRGGDVMTATVIELPTVTSLVTEWRAARERFDASDTDDDDEIARYLDTDTRLTLTAARTPARGSAEIKNEVRIVALRDEHGLRLDRRPRLDPGGVAPGGFQPAGAVITRARLAVLAALGYDEFFISRLLPCPALTRRGFLWSPMDRDYCNCPRCGSADVFFVQRPNIAECLVCGCTYEFDELAGRPAPNDG